MRCNPRVSRFSKIARRFNRADGARRCLVFLLLLTGFGRLDATELSNPMEKHFHGATEEPAVPSGRSGRFSDQTLPDPTSTPQTPPSQVSPTVASVPKKKAKSNNIRQMSGDAASASVWDSAAASLDSETTLADWGVTPSTGPTFAGSPTRPSPPAYGASDPHSGAYGYSPSGAYPQGAFYSNTGPDAAASPGAMNPYGNPYGLPGSGYSPDMAGMPYGGQYGNGPYFGNPYAMSTMADPYGLYGGGMADPNASQFGYGMSPYDPYGMMGGMQNPMQQQMAWQQAMLQQDMLRREVEREIEEEEKAEKEARNAEKEAKDESKWGAKNLMPIHVSSPLGNTLVSCAKTLSPFCTPTGPNRGVGQPLQGASWLDRPWYFGGFCGWIEGSKLVSDMIDQKSGAMGGLILGYNLSEYWGVESRLHFASIDIKETDNGRQVFSDWYMSMVPDATYIPALTTRTNQLSVFDVSVHYYPLGNAKWRPFFKYGLGVARESYVDTYGVKRREDTMTMPLGVGLRYWWNRNLAIQMDLIDNVVFSSGNVKTQNNIAFCVGLTYSFGSSKKNRPTTYWPYTPSHGSKW